VLQVFTFKDASLLSPLAHDLVFGVEPRVARSGAQVEVRVAVAALRVWGKVVSGRVEAMSERDQRDIEATARDKVLDAARHPEVRFAGELGAESVRGLLHLAGRSAALEVPITREGGRIHGRVEFAPSRWGVKPYAALLGQLRLQDRVRVEFDLAEPPAGA
jgi:hypothetical protein